MFQASSVQTVGKQVEHGRLYNDFDWPFERSDRWHVDKAIGEEELCRVQASVFIGKIREAQSAEGTRRNPWMNGTKLLLRKAVQLNSIRII